MKKNLILFYGLLSGELTKEIFNKIENIPDYGYVDYKDFQNIERDAQRKHHIQLLFLRQSKAISAYSTMISTHTMRYIGTTVPVDMLTNFASYDLKITHFLEELKIPDAFSQTAKYAKWHLIYFED